MEISEQSKLHFYGVDILNVSFKAFKPNDKSIKIDMEIDSAFYYPSPDKNQFQIIINIKLLMEKFFDLEIGAVGMFAFSDDTPDELKKNLMNKNAMAIMFPYIRSFISTFSSSCGGVLGNIILPIQFFQGELREIKIPEPSKHTEITA